MFTVTFNPELAVYLNHPYPGDSSVDYTREPITIIGYINQTEAKVTVNGIEAKVEQDGAFSARVQLTLGTNSIQAVAKLGEKADEITYIVGVSPEGRLYPIPGLGAGGPRYQSRVIADESIKIKAGETKSLDVTLEVRKDIREPASFSYKILRVAKEYGKDELPIPEGMKISIEPSRFTIYPNTAYQSTIIIKTSRELVPGEYFFKFEKYYRDAHWMGSWIELSLEP